jgi:hypothetical protein
MYTPASLPRVPDVVPIYVVSKVVKVLVGSDCTGKENLQLQICQMESLHFNKNLEDEITFVIERLAGEFEGFLNRSETVVPVGHHVVETW